MESRKGDFDPERYLELARAGQDGALADLVGHYRPYLSVLARLKRDRQLQARIGDSDVVQEVCLSACRDFGCFQGTTEKEFANWLREILVHVVTNHVRDHHRQRRDVRLERRLHQMLNQSSQLLEHALADPNPSPSHSAVRRERAVLLAEALSQLSEDYREVLVMRELEGKSLAEVADRLGRTTNAVQKLWARALVQLRRLMQTPRDIE